MKKSFKSDVYALGLRGDLLEAICQMHDACMEGNGYVFANEAELLQDKIHASFIIASKIAYVLNSDNILGTIVSTSYAEDDGDDIKWASIDADGCKYYIQVTDYNGTVNEFSVCKYVNTFGEQCDINSPSCNGCSTVSIYAGSSLDDAAYEIYKDFKQK